MSDDRSKLADSLAHCRAINADPALSDDDLDMLIALLRSPAADSAAEPVATHIWCENCEKQSPAEYHPLTMIDVTGKFLGGDVLCKECRLVICTLSKPIEAPVPAASPAQVEAQTSTEERGLVFDIRNFIAQANPLVPGLEAAIEVCDTLLKDEQKNGPSSDSIHAYEFLLAKFRALATQPQQGQSKPNYEPYIVDGHIRGYSLTNSPHATQPAHPQDESVRWIPVGERLPERDDLCLAYTPKSCRANMETGAIEEWRDADKEDLIKQARGWWIRQFAANLPEIYGDEDTEDALKGTKNSRAGQVRYERITHWMPLPTPQQQRDQAQGKG